MVTYVYEENGNNHKRGEKQVNAIAHRLEHLRGESSDDECEEPVGTGNEGLCSHSDVGGEHFGSEDPRLKRCAMSNDVASEIRELTVPFQVGL